MTSAPSAKRLSPCDFIIQADAWRFLENKHRCSNFDLSFVICFASTADKLVEVMLAKNLPVPTWLVAVSRIRSIDQVRQLTAFSKSDCWLELNHFLAQLWRGVIRDDHKFSKICDCYCCRAYRALSDDRRNCTCDSCQQSRDVITLMTSIVLRLTPTQFFSGTDYKVQDTPQPTKTAQEPTSEKPLEAHPPSAVETQTLLETDYQAMAWDMLTAFRGPTGEFNIGICRELHLKQMRFIGHFTNSLEALVKLEFNKLCAADVTWLRHVGQIRLIGALIVQIRPLVQSADVPAKEAALQRLRLVNLALGRAYEATFGQADIQACFDGECQH